MSRACPAFVPLRHFENIDRDNYAPEDLRDEALQALSGASDADDAGRRYEAWREATTGDGHAPVHTTHFEEKERVGRVRYRDSYASALADILRQDEDLGGADESDLED